MQTRLEGADSAKAHQAMGQVLWQQGDRPGALDHFKAACRYQEQDIDLLLTLASAHAQLHQPQEALETYQNIMNLDPTHPESHYEASLILESQGQLKAATALMATMNRLEPQNLLWLDSLGSLYFKQGQLPEAIAVFKQLTQLDPGNPEPWINMGTLQLALNQFDSAQTAFETALQVDPNALQAKIGLSDTLQNLNETVQARSLYQEVLLTLAKTPTPLLSQEVLRTRLATILPVIYQDHEDIAHWQQVLQTELAALEAAPPHLENPVHSVGRTPFYLPYQGRNHVDYQRRLAKVLAPSVPSLTVKARVKAPGEKIRVGFVSKYLQPQHTIGKVMHGVISGLDRTQFEVALCHLGEGLSGSVPFTPHPEDTRVELPLWDTLTAATTLAGLALDILVYCDIGMEPASYFLAFSRLAPVQCVTWGHPITSGIPTVDYYISSTYFEDPIGAQPHYSEKLLCLDELPTCYTPPKLPAHPKSKSDFGLPEDQPLYACPQSLYKLHPDFDPILNGLLAANPEAVLYFFEGFHPRIHQALQARWAKTIPQHHQRLKFLPRVSAEDFYQFLAVIDVMVDPIHFGGGNTSLEALSFGTPIITLPTPLLSGRFTLGFYQKMGIPHVVSHLVAQTPEEYIEKASRLGRDSALRQSLRTDLKGNSTVLFDNPAVIRAWEKALTWALHQTEEPNPLNTGGNPLPNPTQ